MGSGRRELLGAWGPKDNEDGPWGPSSGLDRDYLRMPSFSMIVR